MMGDPFYFKNATQSFLLLRNQAYANAALKVAIVQQSIERHKGCSGSIYSTVVQGLRKLSELETAFAKLISLQAQLKPCDISGLHTSPHVQLLITCTSK